MEIKKNLDLTNYNSYRIHSNCKEAFFPTCEKDFVDIYTRVKLANVIIIGGGYNIIFSKPFYEKSFILIGESFANIEIENDTILSCEAGVNTKDFSEFALAYNLSGAEIFYDIPSSIGGAVVMNAGASGEEIKDILIKVRYLDLVDMTIKEIGNESIGFEYRNSFFQQNTDKVILKAWFKLKKGKPQTIRDKMDAIKQARWSKQPKELPNAGSVFKRPKGFYVGAMIDELNLKGFTVGGAQISKKHGGFIVNFNKASGEDVLKIIEKVKIEVKNKFGVDLEVEQRII